jgi:hypothetical protein
MKFNRQSVNLSKIAVTVVNHSKSFIVGFFGKLAKIKVFPSEIFFVQLGILLPSLTIPRDEILAVLVCVTYTVMTTVTYWFIKSRFRDSGTLNKLWETQVMNKEKSRVSAGVVISMIDHLHIMFFFGGIFLFMVNLLFWFQPAGSTLTDALFTGLMAFNLKGFDDYPAKTIPARLVCAVLSIISVCFTAFLGLVFLKPFLPVFGHNK